MRKGEPVLSSAQNGFEDLVSLDELRPGESGVIRAFNGKHLEDGILMEMGLMVGTEVKLVKFAPLGDPVELSVRGYHLSIRRSEAHFIMVERFARRAV